jgi:uncharacterized protein YcbK (DUF882 family)
MKNYFPDYEQRCPCCKQGNLQPEFLKVLNEARAIRGAPIYLNSAYRCPKHNITIPGSSPYSSHLEGWAADVKALSDADKYELVDIFKSCGITRFGIRARFIHIDMDPDKNPRRIWGY